MIEIKIGDCTQRLKDLEDNSVDTVICDPPYGLKFMSKGWDDIGDGSQQREWHRAWLTEAHRVLKPNGVIKAFSGTRTFHHLIAMMGELGFSDLRVEAWVYGSGFPKSLNVSKAIEKLGGVDREIEIQICSYLQSRREELGLTLKEVDEKVFGGTTRYSWVEGRRGDRVYLPTPCEWAKLKNVLKIDSRYDSYIEEAIPTRENRHSTDGGKAKTLEVVKGNYGYQQGDRWGKDYRITMATSKDSKQWEGWGTALKPAWEPVCIGVKK